MSAICLRLANENIIYNINIITDSMSKGQSSDNGTFNEKSQ